MWQILLRIVTFGIYQGQKIQNDKQKKDQNESEQIHKDVQAPLLPPPKTP